MSLRTAKQIIEDEVKEYRKELLQGVTKRSELRECGYETHEIDEIIQQEKDDIEREVAEHRSALLEELPEREAALAETRDYTFASVAFNDVWLPNCLEPSDEEASALVTKTVYESYLAWCETVGVRNIYSLPRVRQALKDHYAIENIRTGLRQFQLANVPTKLNREQVISWHEADERKREREAEKLRGLTCSYCERRKYDGNRFDRCYWCSRILKDGLTVALAEYLIQDVGWERTGESMYLAHSRMVERGEITPQTLPVDPGRPSVTSQARMLRAEEKKPYWKMWIWGAIFALVVILIILALA